MSDCNRNALGSKLEHCPFCPSGGDPRIETAMGEAWVLCHECGASSEMKATVEGAVKHWNTRFERTCHSEAFIPPERGGSQPAIRSVCSECGDRLGVLANYCKNCGAKAVRL